MELKTKLGHKGNKKWYEQDSKTTGNNGKMKILLKIIMKWMKQEIGQDVGQKNQPVDKKKKNGMKCTYRKSHRK